MLPQQRGCHPGSPVLFPQKRDAVASLLPSRMPVLACHEKPEVVNMNWIVGYLFDGWNSLLCGIEEMGKAIDRAWGDDDE